MKTRVKAFAQVVRASGVCGCVRVGVRGCVRERESVCEREME